MSEKTSKKLLKIELFVIVLPSSILLLGAILSHIGNMREYSLWGDEFILLLAFVACGSLISGLIILNSFIKHGVSGLRSLRPYLWLASFLGVAIIIASWISNFTDPSPRYSDEAIFRFYFEAFSYASPLLIPFIHLLLERFFRKDTNIK